MATRGFLSALPVSQAKASLNYVAKVLRRPQSFHEPLKSPSDIDAADDSNSSQNEKPEKPDILSDAKPDHTDDSNSCENEKSEKPNILSDVKPDLTDDSNSSQNEKPEKHNILSDVKPHLDAATHFVAGWLKQTGKVVNHGLTQLDKRPESERESEVDALHDTKAYVGKCMNKLGDVAESAFERAANWTEEANHTLQEEPAKAAAKVSLFAVKTAVMISPAIVWGPILNVAGFGAAGVAGSSAASFAQSKIGSVTAGSAFSMLQSAGAGGYGVAAMNAIVQGGTMGVVAGKRVFDHYRNTKK